jgi:chorismate dehydratase
MKRMLKIAAVSYTNTTPFLYGLEKIGLPFPYELLIDVPSKCWENLKTGKADIGLVPVAKLNSIDRYYIHSDYCIGCDGKVDSVFLFSQVPLEEITEVLMDYQSETSIRLTRVLAKEHWEISPQWTKASKGFEKKITGSVAGVVIGDRTFDLKHQFKYAYDLGEEWMRYSGMPFVFACWVSLNSIEASKIEAFNNALSYGIENIEEMFDKIETNFDSNSYLKENIDFNFDKRKKEALRLFLDLSKEFV